MAEFKKIKKILLINLIALIAIFGVIEFLAFKFPPKDIANLINTTNAYAEKHGLGKAKIKYMAMVPFDINSKYYKIRPKITGKSSKRPILLFGCSFTYGVELNENQTLSYKLYKLTDRTVYNRGIPGTGSQHILYQLRQKDFYNKVPDAEIIIYTLIQDHFNRLYKYLFAPSSNSINLRYEFKNGKLQEVQPRFLPFYSLFSVQRVQDYIKMQRTKQTEETFKLFLQIMTESKKLTDKNYPNSKFVILLYECGNGEIILSEKQIKTLENNGFIVIDVKKLTGHELVGSKYTTQDKIHPSEKAWDEITPQLVKALKL